MPDEQDAPTPEPEKPEELTDDNPLALFSNADLIGELAHRSDNLIIVYETGRGYECEGHGHAVAISGLLTYATAMNRRAMRAMIR